MFRAAFGRRCSAEKGAKVPEPSFTDKTVGLDTACAEARKHGIPWLVVAKAIVTEPLPMGGTAFRIPAAVVKGWGRSTNKQH